VNTTRTDPISARDAVGSAAEANRASNTARIIRVEYTMTFSHEELGAKLHPGVRQQSPLPRPLAISCFRPADKPALCGRPRFRLGGRPAVHKLLQSVSLRQMLAVVYKTQR
jgi:hypothetical protein